MFFKRQNLLKNLKIFSDGSLIKNFDNFTQLNSKINFSEKDFKFRLKNSLKKKSQHSNLLNNYRKSIFK